MFKTDTVDRHLCVALCGSPHRLSTKISWSAAADIAITAATGTQHNVKVTQHPITGCTESVCLAWRGENDRVCRCFCECVNGCGGYWITFPSWPGANTRLVTELMVSLPVFALRGNNNSCVRKYLGHPSFCHLSLSSWARRCHNWA